MSRLDALIKRMTAQRACLDYLTGLLENRAGEGIVVELGLGSGRTYDHLRETLPGRDIFVFDYKVDCHPACTPPVEFIVLGEIANTLPEFAKKNAGRAALIHCDVGTTDRERDRALYTELTPYIRELGRAGTLIASDCKISFPGLIALPLPKDTGDWPYYVYQCSTE